MNEGKRKIGEYTVLCSVNVGEKEVILASNEQSTNGDKFMCGFAERNDLFELCSECMVSDDYIEIVHLFGSRVANEAELFKEQVEKLDIPITLITEADCIPDHYSKDINGKIIAIDPKVLKPEFQRADRQLYYVTGGFGASANSRGSAVFCTNLHTGKSTRYERMDVMGEIKPERLPEWAKEKAQELSNKKRKDYFKMGNRYGRVLFLREYASYIKDSMVAELTDLNRNLMMSIDIVPVPTDEAVREAESRLLGVETNITNWQRKQNQNNNFSATVPYDMEQQKKEMKEFLDDLTTRDQRMMFAVLTMVHTADSKEQLDNDTEALLTTARKHLCQFAVLKYQQMDGLNTAMPFGTRKIDAFRTLTTESLAVFIPFRVQDIYHENGIYYGQNVISKNMIIADRRQLLNGNSFILGVSGGGKSFAAKGEIENIILSSNADVIIIDPEREYSQLVKALGGEIINISATSPSHINAMDMNKEYGDGANPVILKSEFIMSLCEQLIGGTNLGAKQKSIIDRCTASVYRDYQQRGYTGTVPTLQDFRAELLKQDEPEAKEIALAIELFTHGSLNTFAKPTNVDTDNRLICYDILDLGKQLMPIGMLVVLDSILNRITQNRAKGKQTFIFIDEIYLLFQHEYSANFLFTLWKRVRKYGAYATGITQNVDVRPDRALCKAV